MPRQGRSWNPLSGKLMSFVDGVKKIIDFSRAFESAGGFFRITDRVHAEAHEGELFSVTKITTSVADNDEVSLIVTNPSSDKEFHLTYVAKGTAIADVCFFTEATLDSNPGTLKTARNHKVNKASNPDDSIAIAYVDANPSADGTLRYEDIIPGSSGGQSSGGSIVSREEFIIGPGQNAHLKVINRGGAGKTIALAVTFYEETEGSV